MAKDYRFRVIFALFTSIACATIVLCAAFGVHESRWKRSYLTFEPELHAFAAEAYSLWAKYCTSSAAEALAEQCELWRRAKDVQATRVAEDFWWFLQWKDLDWAKWALAGTTMLVTAMFVMLPEEKEETKRMKEKKDSAKVVEPVVVDAATQSSA